MSAIPQPSTALSEVERRWDAYLAAKRQADATGDYADGLAAGRAWAAFLDMFLPPESPMPRSPLRVVK
jgi:hypothetical protein